MRITASWSADELFRFLAQLFPVDVRLGETDERRLRLRPPESFEMVPGSGVRLRTRADLFWPLPLVEDGLALPTVTALAVPRIVDRDGWTLAVGLRLEHVDLAVLPRSVASAMSAGISGALERVGVEVAWGYADTLGVDIALPGTIVPPRTFKLRADEGSVRVDSEGLTIEAPLHLAFVRIP